MQRLLPVAVFGLSLVMRHQADIQPGDGRRHEHRQGLRQLTCVKATGDRGPRTTGPP